MPAEDRFVEFLKNAQKSGKPTLILSDKGMTVPLLERVSSILSNVVVVDGEHLSHQEMDELFFQKLLQEGNLVFLLTTKTPLFVVGALNHLLKENRIKINTAGGWKTLHLHPKLQIWVIAEEDSLIQFQGFIKKTDFLYRHREKNFVEKK
jgi:hypothetical protein